MYTVFLDRDGTIGGNGDGIHPDEFTMYDISPKAIKMLNDAGIRVLLFTNQGRIGMGYFTEEQLLRGYDRLIDRLSEDGAVIDEMYYCPHAPGANCECRKPEIRLLLEAKEKHNLDFEKCFVVGDRMNTDMLAAQKAGIKKILVKTGKGEEHLSQMQRWNDIHLEYIAEDILDCVQWIIEEVNQSVST